MFAGKENFEFKSEKSTMDEESEVQPLRRRLVSAEKVEKVPRESYGLAMGQLKSWREERKTKLMEKESTKQGIAVGKVIGFLNAIGQFYHRILQYRGSLPFSSFQAWR